MWRILFFRGHMWRILLWGGPYVKNPNVGLGCVRSYCEAHMWRILLWGSYVKDLIVRVICEGSYSEAHMWRIWLKASSYVMDPFCEAKKNTHMRYILLWDQKNIHMWYILLWGQQIKTCVIDYIHDISTHDLGSMLYDVGSFGKSRFVFFFVWQWQMGTQHMVKPVLF